MQIGDLAAGAGHLRFLAPQRDADHEASPARRNNSGGSGVHLRDRDRWELAHPGRLAPLLGGSQGTPRWWDDASVSVGRAIARAVRRIGEAGYAYIPDPVFDEPYDGRIHRSDMVSWPDWAGMRWISRLLEHVRYPHSSTGYEHASAAKRLADP